MMRFYKWKLNLKCSHRAIAFVMLYLCIGITVACGQRKFNVIDFGAQGDGMMLNTAAIQKAIDKANSKGGGTVIIPAGHFLCGTITLKTGVTLWLDKDAFLVGSTNPLHYKKANALFGLIMAYDAHNIAISGKGTIDGQGLALALTIDSLHHTGIQIDSNYNYRRMRPNNRPKIIDFSLCKQIEVKNVTIKNSSSWVQNYTLCERILIDSVTVNSVAFWNNDGIDISDCKDVTITQCFVNAADDAICLKSERVDKFNDNIYIANCTLRSSANGVKLGTSSVGGFKNIRIENITVFDTYRSALALECVDGGILENVEVSNIHAMHTGNAIFVRLGHRNADTRIGVLRNVHIRNVIAEIPFERPDLAYDLRGPDVSFFHNPFPASVTGVPGQEVENVHFENIEITYPGRATKGMSYISISRLNQVPEKENEYPEFSMFGELPAWGFYVRHVHGVTMKNIRLRLKDKDFRPAFVFDDVDKLHLSQFYLPPQQKTSAIILQYCSDLSITESDILKEICTVEPLNK